MYTITNINKTYYDSWMQLNNHNHKYKWLMVKNKMIFYAQYKTIYATILYENHYNITLKKLRKIFTIFHIFMNRTKLWEH